MKITRKIIALIIAAVTVFSVASVAVCAIDSKNLGEPVFQAVLVSETTKEAVVEFSIVSGNFASAEFTFVPQGNFGSISKFAKADGLKAFLAENDVPCVSKPETGRLAIATSTPIEGQMSLYRITFLKKTSANTKISDLKIICTNCDSCLSANTGNTSNITNRVTASFTLMKLELDKYSLDMNYKKTEKLNVITAYDKTKLVWTSSNAKVATVDKDGNVTTTGTGNAVIKVATEDGNSFAECTVNSSYSVIQWIIVIVFFGWLWY